MPHPNSKSTLLRRFHWRDRWQNQRELPRTNPAAFFLLHHPRRRIIIRRRRRRGSRKGSFHAFGPACSVEMGGRITRRVYDLCPKKRQLCKSGTRREHSGGPTLLTILSSSRFPSRSVSIRHWN